MVPINGKIVLQCDMFEVEEEDEAAKVRGKWRCAAETIPGRAIIYLLLGALNRSCFSNNARTPCGDKLSGGN